MKAREYSNFDALKFSAKVAEENITLDTLNIARVNEYGDVLYATGTITSQNDGTVYSLRYKLADGAVDTECSCPACTKGRYFCKHQMALWGAVAQHESHGG